MHRGEGGGVESMHRYIHISLGDITAQTHLGLQQDSTASTKLQTEDLAISITQKQAVNTTCSTVSGV